MRLSECPFQSLKDIIVSVNRVRVIGPRKDHAGRLFANDVLEGLQAVVRSSKLYGSQLHGCLGDRAVASKVPTEGHVYTMTIDFYLEGRFGRVAEKGDGRPLYSPCGSK